jgi:SET domain-containing protein
MYIVRIKIGDSSIDGRGVFAEEAIPTGKKVWVFQLGYDLTKTKEEFEALPGEEKEYLSRTAYLSPWSGLWVYPPKGDAAEYTNHSLENNLSVMFDPDVSPEPFFVANRDIKVGEELTNNYHEFDEVTRQTKPEWAEE